jgi:DNA replication protein DnaC
MSHACGHLARRRTQAPRHVHVSYRQLRKLLAVDLIILDDFGLDAMDATESRDAYEILVERHRAGSIIVTSNRGPDEWLPTFADPVRAQSAIDRFTGNSYDLVIEGESYRSRLKPRLRAGQKGAN